MIFEKVNLGELNLSMKENFNPLDLRVFKDIVKQESSRLRLRSVFNEGESAFTLALALSAAVKKIFYEKSSMTFSDEPVLEKRTITEFKSRMRVDAMEKFNATTVFSVIQFAAKEEDLDREAYLITLLVYLEQKYLPEFLRLLQYPYIDSDDVDEVKDGCGTLGNLIAGQYKREKAALGFKDVMMSHFESHINTVADGVSIPQGAKEKYELSFEVEEVKRLVVEVIAPSLLPRWSPKEKTGVKKILIIDDDPTHVKLAGAFLQSKGFKVLVARDGTEGIEQLKEKPDVIILDLNMPNMDGYEFVLAIKELAGGKHAPIIIMTMKQGMHDLVKVEGIKEYLLKPFNPDTLLKSIERYI